MSSRAGSEMMGGRARPSRTADTTHPQSWQVAPPTDAVVRGCKQKGAAAAAAVVGGVGIGASDGSGARRPFSSPSVRTAACLHAGVGVVVVVVGALLARLCSIPR